MKFMKRTIAWLLTFMLLMTVLPSSLIMTAFAAEFEDFPTGWSAEAVRAAVDNGLIKGKTNGLIEPESNLTRAEAATIINRAFGSTVKADISSFEDVAPADWYYEEMAKAVNMKTFVGDGSHLYPNDSITREEMFTVIARALVLSDYSSDVLKKFTDSSEISDYAVPYLAALAANGYINGNPDGTLKPKSYITREEFAQVMHNIFKTYIGEAGTYTKLDGQDSVVIRAGGVTLKNVTIEKDLVLGDGVGAGDIKLENVTIKGRLLCRGGEGKVHLVKTTVGDKVVVYDVNGTVNFNNYRTEAPFKDIAEHTPATFLEKQTGGVSGTSGSITKNYTIEVYFQNESVLPGQTPVYGGKDPTFDKVVKAKKGLNVSLSWEDIDEMYDTTTGWNGILAKYELDTENSVLTGKNDGSLVLKVYLKKKVFTVTASDGAEYKYFYNEALNTNSALVSYIDAYESEQEALGYDVSWKDANGNPVALDKLVTENITLQADLTAIPYSITYETNGGDPIAQGSYTVETLPFTLPTATRGADIFEGWHKESDLSDTAITELAAGTIGDITLYAEWTPAGPDNKTYTVNAYFQDDTTLPGAAPSYGSSDPAYSKTFENDENATITYTWAEIEAMYGSVAGWAEVLNKYELDEDTSILTGTNDGALEIRVYFKKKVFTVTDPDNTEYKYFYNEALNTNSALVSYIDAYESEQEALGYDVSWKDANGNPVALDKLVTENITLQAELTAITYSITYETNGGDPIAQGTYTVEDLPFTLPTATKGTDTFEGWHKESDLSDAAITVLVAGTVGDIILYAEWTPAGGPSDKTYNVNVYFQDDSTLPGETPVYGNYDSSYTKSFDAEENVTITYTWAEIDALYAGNADWAEVLNKYELDDAASVLTGTNDGALEIKVYLKKKVFTVTDPDGAEYKYFYNEALNTNSALVSYIDAYESEQEALGYDVIWKDANDNPVALDKLVTENITLQADHAAITYSITYETNGGDPIAQGTYTVEDLPFTLPTATRGADIFEGWHKESDLSDAAITELAAGTIGDITLYAEWTPAGPDNKTYTVNAYFQDDTTLPGAAPSYGSSDPAYSKSFEADENATITYTWAEIEAMYGSVAGWAEVLNKYELDEDTSILTGTNDGALEIRVYFKKKVFTVTDPDGAEYKYFYKEALNTNSALVSYIDAYESEQEALGYDVIWKDANDNPVTLDKLVEENITLQAELTAITYSITYETNGGDPIAQDTYTVEDLPFTLPTATKGEDTFEGWHKESDLSDTAITELAAGTTGDIILYAEWTPVVVTYYTVKVYKGTERPQNLRNTIQNVPAGTKLTPEQVYENIGTPDNYKVEGYTDSDGNIHYVTPELMYNNNGTWEVFDIENTAIESDLALCMLNRTIRISLVTDRTIKGVELPEVAIEVAYDSESSISESALDGLTLAKFQMETILDLLKDEKGFDPHKSLVARLSSKGITDENGTFIAKDVALKMGDFISVEQIEGKIDEYIEDSLDDDEFIVSLLENETIVNSFLGNANLKKAFMDDDDLRNKLIDEELIKDMASDSEIVDYIIASESFRQSFLNNDATFDYVMNDPSIKSKILNNADFRKVLVDECIKLVIDVYFEETKSAPGLYDYIDSVLKSDEFIQKIEAEEELKDVLEDEIKDLVKNADATIKAELYAAIRGNDNLKNQIIEVIKTDATVFNGIKDVVKNDTAIRDDIKDDVKDDAKDTIKDLVETWILNNIAANDTLKSEIIGYILANNTVKDAIIADKSITDAELNTYLSDNTNLIDAVETYFDNIYDLSYDDMYDTFFNDFYADADIFDKAYAEFIDNDANFKTAFETYIENDTYLDIAFNTFVDDAVAFDTFYDTYVGDDDRFNELFEKYYPTHVHDVAKSAYDNVDMHDMIEEYVRDYTEDLAIEYADETLGTKHPELVDTINGIMENDMPDAVRTAYNEPGSKIKTLIDELIESNAQTLIDKYLNDLLTSDEKTIIEDAIYDYADDVAEDYINDDLDGYLKDFIDDAIETEVEGMIDDFIAGTNRDDVRKLLTDHTDEAIEAFKETDIYKDIIDIFRNKEDNIFVNADNLFVARGIAKAVESYTYEQIKEDFLNEKLQKLLDLVGDSVFEKYVDEAVERFVTGLNAVCDDVDDDIANGNRDTEYSYPAKLIADINVISEILYPLYNKAMAKAKAKLESYPQTKYKENPYFMELLNTNLLDKIFFDKTTGADGEALYTLKSDISEMYSASLEMVILAHDAVVWYAKYEDQLDAKAADVAVILAGYANRLNGIIMNYIENGELPKDITLEDLFNVDGRIETAYDRVDEYIDKLLAKYEEYLDRDYEEVFERLATGTITANGENFDIIDIALETKIFDVDDAFDVVLGGNRFTSNEYVNKIINKLESTEVTPEANPARYYIDAYKATLDNREIKGVSTGTHTVRVERYLK